MKTKMKKWIYILCSIALAVEIFLSGIIFIRSNSFEGMEVSSDSVSIDSSSIDSVIDKESGLSSEGDENSGNGGNGLGNEGNGDNGNGGNGLGGGGNGDNGSGGSGSGLNGNGNGAGEMPSLPKEDYLFRIRSDESGVVYLREATKGAYTGKGEHGFEDDCTYSTAVGEIDPSEYFAYALQNSGKAAYYVDMELKADLLRLYPYYNNKIYESDAGIMQYRAQTFAYAYDANTIGRLKSF